MASVHLSYFELINLNGYKFSIVRSVSNIWTVLLLRNKSKCWEMFWGLGWQFPLLSFAHSFQQVLNYWMTSFNMLAQMWLWALNMKKFFAVRAYHLCHQFHPKWLPFLLSITAYSPCKLYLRAISESLMFTQFFLFLFSLTQTRERKRESKRERQVDVEQTPPRK